MLKGSGGSGIGGKDSAVHQSYCKAIHMGVILGLYVYTNMCIGYIVIMEKKMETTP